MKLYYLLGYKAVTPDFFSSMSFPGNIKGKFRRIASYATTQWGKHFGRLVFEVKIRQVACTLSGRLLALYIMYGVQGFRRSF